MPEAELEMSAVSGLQQTPVLRLLNWLIDPSRLFALLAAYGVLAILFPRFTPVLTLAGVTVVHLVVALDFVLRGRAIDWVRSGVVTKASVLLLAMFFVSCAWSAAPLDGLTKTVTLLALLATGLSIATLIERLAVPQLKAIATGLALGVAIASIYITLNTLLDREIERQLHEWLPILREGYEGHYPTAPSGKVLYVTHIAFNRATCAFAILTIPVLTLAYLFLEGRLRIVVISLVTIAAGAVLLKATHQSSQLALLAGGATMVIAYFSTKAAKALVAAMVVISFALIVPFSLWAVDNGYHFDKNIPYSMRARLIHWDYTSEKILERPLLGVGTSATQYLDDLHEKTWVQPEGFVVPRRTSAHPHNIYLQIIYEVGIVGAIVATIFAMSLLWKASTLPRLVAPFALAQCAVGAVILIPSYGLWQTWLQALLGVSCLGIWLAAALVRRTGEKEVS